MIPDEYVKRLPGLLAYISEKMPGKNSGATPSSLLIPVEKLDEKLRELAGRLVRHYPFHQPIYAGQMLKPPHPVAWLAYALAMTINPNNHALDGGPEASYMEKEVMRMLVNMVGFPDDALGHLASSGTIANLEALWVARELHPDRPVAVSTMAHYTHQRMGQVLQHPVVVLPEDEDGLPDPHRFDTKGPLPGTVVVTLGTTGQGRVEPLHRVLEWARTNDVRIHVDAAYGGFFHLLRSSGLIDADLWNVLPQADSIVIDPHKHGLQPYGCGAVLFRDPAVGRFYRHDSPYTYFTSDDLHLGEISLECSRAGAAAVALWLTLQLLLPESLPGKIDQIPTGEDGAGTGSGLPQILMDCRSAALGFYAALDESTRFRPVMRPELDIVSYIPVTREQTRSAVSRMSEQILRKGMEAESDDQKIYLSTLVLNHEEARRRFPELAPDQDNVRVLRSVLMKPEHLGFIPELMRRLDQLHVIICQT